MGAVPEDIAPRRAAPAKGEINWVPHTLRQLYPGSHSDRGVTNAFCVRPFYVLVCVPWPLLSSVIGFFAETFRAKANCA